MLIITAPAKINISLDVLSKRPDGYHELDMVMQTISLADWITLEPSQEIEVSCSNSQLPGDCRNLAWRAAQLLREETGVAKGVRIHLTKNIPVAAGLGGGSSDAAAVLIALNTLWELGLTRTRLLEIGLKLGADVPFCIFQGTARARGIGEVLTRIDSKLSGRLLLVTPRIEVSTTFVFGALQVDRINRHPRVSKVVEAIMDGNQDHLILSWGNVLEEVVLEKFPMVGEVKEYFCRFGLTNNLMSGSGPTIFALNPPEGIIQPFLAEMPTEWFGSLAYF